MVNYYATEGMGTALRECSAHDVYKSFLDECRVLRAKHRDGVVEYIAGTRYDPSPTALRWELRTADNVIEVICTGIVVREFASDVEVQQATVDGLERDSGESFR